jgi:hypothetical protein
MSVSRLLSNAGLALLSVVALGCASAGGMRNAPLDVGTARTFDGAFSRVLRAAREATVASGLAIDSFEQPDSATAVIVSKKGSSAFSWGELVRVVVQRADSAHVVVRVYSKRRMATNITAKGDYSSTIFQNMDLSLRE